ncbi:MAG: tetratricopeptide repeat protein [Anaerolineae bacterium]
MGINPKKLYKEQKRKMMNLGNLELQKLLCRIMYNNKDVDAYYKIGLLYYHDRQYDKAISYFDGAIELDPTAYLLTLRGGAYFQAGHYAKAIACFDEAIEFDPQYPVAYLGRGLSYQMLGKHDLATVSFDLARQMNRIHGQPND